MEKTQTPVVGLLVLVLLAAAAAMGVMRMSKTDVEFCRKVLNGLVEGRPSVQRWIDWEHLKALEVDVGATYTHLASDAERAQYRRAFVESFSKGFRQANGVLNAFRHWRVHERGDGRIVIAVEYEAKQKTLLLSLPASGKKKLEAIQWQ